MISNIAKLSIKIGERSYELLCACDAPIGEVHDALCAMKSYVVKRIQDADKAPDEPKQEGGDNG